jgi:hypothetical protein
VPGGTTAAILVATVGFLTTTLTIALSLIPQPDEPNKPLALFKIVGGTGALVAIGAWIYWAGKRRAAKDAREIAQLRTHSPEASRVKPPF